MVALLTFAATLSAVGGALGVAAAGALGPVGLSGSSSAHLKATAPKASASTATAAAAAGAGAAARFFFSRLRSEVQAVFVLHTGSRAYAHCV